MGPPSRVGFWHLKSCSDLSLISKWVQWYIFGILSIYSCSPKQPFWNALHGKMCKHLFFRHYILLARQLSPQNVTIIRRQSLQNVTRKSLTKTWTGSFGGDSGQPSSQNVTKIRRQSLQNVTKKLLTKIWTGSFGGDSWDGYWTIFNIFRM